MALSVKDDEADRLARAALIERTNPDWRDLFDDIAAG
jgi:hypothetical protein